MLTPINQIISESKQPDAKIGDPATILMWSDRHAATVIKVTPCTVTVQVDKAKRLDKGGPYTESQTYEYERNPNGQKIRFWRTQRGWSADGMRLAIGHRNEYHDPHF